MATLVGRGVFCKYRNKEKLSLKVCNHLKEEEKADCFSIIVLQMYSYYKCSVALPHGAVGWSAGCGCGIF